MCVCSWSGSNSCCWLIQQCTGWISWNREPQSKAIPGCILIVFFMIGLGMKGSILKCRSSLANFRVSLLKSMAFTLLWVLVCRVRQGTLHLQDFSDKPLSLWLPGLERVEISSHASWLCAALLCLTDTFSYHKQNLRENTNDPSVSSHFIASEKWKSNAVFIVIQAYFLTTVLLLNCEWCGLGISKGKYNRMRTLRVFKIFVLLYHFSPK